MKIKKMTATFGNLKNSRMELDSGLNIIEGANEFGKSTWCAFIKSMLYGIDTSSRDRAGHLSDKTRYRPWDGSAPAGTMELENNGRDITIQRTGKGTQPFKNLIAVYTGTADFIKDMTSETAGETLTGVSEHVFERTAFIRRKEMHVDQTSDLEKRISSLVMSGEENSSYSEADSLLRSWQRKIKYNKSGELPALEQKLSEAEEQMKELNRNAEELSSLSATIKRLETQRDNLTSDLETHDKIERRDKARKIKEMRTRAEEDERKLEKLNASITHDGHTMTREDINSIRETASSLTPLRGVLENSEKALSDAEKSLNEAERKLESSPLRGLTESEAETLADHAAELHRSAERSKKRKIPKFIPVLLIVLGAVLLLLSCGILSPFAEWMPSLESLVSFSAVRLIISLVLVAVGIVLSVYKPSGGAYETELNGILTKYGLSSADKLRSLTDSYTGLIHSRNTAAAVRDSAAENQKKAEYDLHNMELQAVEQISSFMPYVTSGKDVLNALEETEKILEEITKTRLDMISCRSVYDTLSEGYDGDPDADDQYLPVPLRSREDTLAALDRTESQLSETVHNFDLASGAKYKLKDPSVVKGNIDSLNERIAEDNRRYDALSLAVEVLADADSDLQRRFSPVISRRAGDIMSRLSGGRYENLIFDKGFNAMAKTSDDPVRRDVLSLSDGTADEIYFSLRLAMCELILGGDDPCPIILDDALLNFDDLRCRSALELLLELSSERQIILFTCHTREADFMEGRPGVNIVRQPA